MEKPWFLSGDVIGDRPIDLLVLEALGAEGGEGGDIKVTAPGLKGAMLI